MHGECDKPLECKCLPGFRGLLCQSGKKAFIFVFSIKQQILTINILQLCAPQPAAENMVIVKNQESADAEQDGWERIATNAMRIQDASTGPVASHGSAIVSQDGVVTSAMSS